MTLPRSPRYFGCAGPIGHFVYQPNMARGESNIQWLAYLDGLLPPEVETQGVARLHHFNGCTLLAFWDRTGDSRPGSNSVFFIPGRVLFDEAVEAARKAFPGIWRRFTFEVVLEAR